MLDRPRYESWLRRAGESEITRILDPEEDIAPLAEQCLRLGAKAVLLKCGAPGMYLRTAAAAALAALQAQITPLRAAIQL